jgi:type I restriction enzyme, S subunit
LKQQHKFNSEGLFEIPDFWMWAISSDVCSSVRDGTHDTPKYVVDNGIPLVTSKNLKNGYIDFETARLISIEDHKQISLRSEVENGDILFAMIGTIGNPIVVNIDRQFSIKNIGLFKKNEAVIKSIFLRYWLLSEPLNKILEIQRFISGTTQKFISLGSLRSIPIPLPPLNEQRRIVSTIEQLTDRSNKARAALEDVPKLIAQFRQSVLAAAFRGDLTADWREKNPDIEPASELLERTAIQLGENYQETRLSIDRSDDCSPKSWSWSKLKLVVRSIQSGKNFSCPEIPVTKDTVGLAKISAVTWDKFNSQETKTVIDKSKIDPKLFIKSGDLLVSRANTLELVGASVVVEEIDYKIMLSDKVWRIHLVDTDKKYVHYYLKSSLGRQEIESRANGNQASMRNLSQKAFQDIIIPIPPIEEQHEIVRHIEDALDAIDSILTHKLATLEELNQLDRSILAKAFRGELVPQDPNDEPAAILLDRIRVERAGTEGRRIDRTSTPKQRGKATRKNSSKQLSIEGIE